MANRPYPYYPAWDNTKVSPGITALQALCKTRWQTGSYGTYVNRNMRNSGNLSVHATGAAWDMVYKDEKQARVIWDWFLHNSKALGLCELHWYAYSLFGAGYRCSRGEDKAGVKIYTADNNAGSYEGSPNWLHIEIDQKMANDAALLRRVWAALPYP